MLSDNAQAPSAGSISSSITSSNQSPLPQQSGRAKELWREATVEQRLRFLNEELIVLHPEMLSAVDAIKRRIHRCIAENKGAAIYIEVPSGGGKTTLGRFFKKALPDKIGEEFTHIPVVTFQIPKVITLKGMDSALLTAMGDPKPTSGTHDELSKRSITALKNANTEVVFIDNIQDVPEKRRIGGILQIGNWIRDLIDDSHRLVVLLGTDTSRPILAANIQLRRRCSSRKRISYFKITENFGMSRLKRFLHELDKVLPLAEPSDLTSGTVLHAFACATFGIQDYIFQILSCALARAVEAGRERIEMSDLAHGFSETFQDAGKGINPFLNEANRPLNREGEPFFELSGSPAGAETAR